MKTARRILRGTVIAFGVLALLLALFAVLAPRVANVEAVRSSIEKAVSGELGGKVTFGRVGLGLFPRPEIEIREVTVEIPGTLSASVAAARASVRLLPLLRGRFAVESATLDRPALVVTVPGAAAPAAGAASRSPADVLAVPGRAAPGLALKVARGSLSVVRDGTTALALGELDARLVFVPPGKERSGLPAGAPAARFHVTGEAQAVVGRSASLPGPLQVSVERLDAVPERLAVGGARLRLLDMEVRLDGSVGDYLSAAPRADLAAAGTVGPAAAAWLGTLAGLPGDLRVRAPLTVADARLRTSGSRAGPVRELSGSFGAKDGPAIPFELRQEPGLVSLRRLQVKDAASDALAVGTAGDAGVDLAFRGTLAGATLLRFLDGERVPFGSVSGDIRVRVPRGRRREATAQGSLEARNLAFPTGAAGALAAERLSVRGDGRTLSLKAPTAALGRYVANDVALKLSLLEGGAAVDLERAAVCGISLAGRLTFGGREVDLTLRPQARGRKLDEDLRCLLGWDAPPSGAYDLAGSISARGSRDTLLRSLQGSLDFSAKKGRIANAAVVEGVIAYLEKTSVLKGSQAAQLREGIPYDALTLRGTLRDGVVSLAKVAVRSKAVQAAAEGDVDLRGRTLALTVLVAPLTGFDRAMSKVPLVRHVAGGGLVVVPVRVEGTFDRPQVKHLPASGVATSAVNLMKNIVQAPLKIIEPESPPPAAGPAPRTTSPVAPPSRPSGRARSSAR